MLLREQEEAMIDLSHLESTTKDRLLCPDCGKPVEYLLVVESDPTPCCGTCVGRRRHARQEAAMQAERLL